MKSSAKTNNFIVAFANCDWAMRQFNSNFITSVLESFFSVRFFFHTRILLLIQHGGEWVHSTCHNRIFILQIDFIYFLWMKTLSWQSQVSDRIQVRSYNISFSEVQKVHSNNFSLSSRWRSYGFSFSQFRCIHNDDLTFQCRTFNRVPAKRLKVMHCYSG